MFVLTAKLCILRMRKESSMSEKGKESNSLAIEVLKKRLGQLNAMRNVSQPRIGAQMVEIEIKDIEDAIWKLEERMVVSKEFIELKQKRFNDKEPGYGGDDNPKNWKNMTQAKLHDRIMDQADVIHVVYLDSDDDELLEKELADMSNLCELLFRKARLDRRGECKEIL